MKGHARENLASAFAARPFAVQETVIRVNALDTAEFADDLRVAAGCRPNAILLPKVNTSADLERFAAALGTIVDGSAPRLWAMIETAAAIHHIDGILHAGRNSSCSWTAWSWEPMISPRRPGCIRARTEHICFPG